LLSSKQETDDCKLGPTHGSFVEWLGCWIARDLKGVVSRSQWKHQMQ